MGGQESAGEGVIVGVLDTGIWPEHPSFSDPDPSGKPYAPLASWHGTSCQFGSAVPGDVPFTCNNKLVGAARFMATYSALQTLLPDEYLSARDDDGHGTHTSSTSAGNAKVAASIFGISRGTDLRHCAARPRCYVQGLRRGRLLRQRLGGGCPAGHPRRRERDQLFDQRRRQSVSRTPWSWRSSTLITPACSSPPRPATAALAPTRRITEGRG